MQEPGRKHISVQKMMGRLMRNGMMKKIGLSLLLNLEADNAKIVQLEREPVVL
jgi:hypothetical protein